MISTLHEIVLGSASPRRKDLLEGVGLEFSIDVADIDETVHPGESPEALVKRLEALYDVGKEKNDGDGE